jgi:hypothetical protein
MDLAQSGHPDRAPALPDGGIWSGIAPGRAKLKPAAAQAKLFLIFILVRTA